MNPRPDDINKIISLQKENKLLEAKKKAIEEARASEREILSQQLAAMAENYSVKFVTESKKDYFLQDAMSELDRAKIYSYEQWQIDQQKLHGYETDKLETEKEAWRKDTNPNDNPHDKQIQSLDLSRNAYDDEMKKYERIKETQVAEPKVNMRNSPEYKSFLNNHEQVIKSTEDKIKKIINDSNQSEGQLNKKIVENNTQINNDLKQIQSILSDELVKKLKVMMNDPTLNTAGAAFIGRKLPATIEEYRKCFRNEKGSPKSNEKIIQEITEVLNRQRSQNSTNPAVIRVNSLVTTLLTSLNEITQQVKPGPNQDLKDLPKKLEKFNTILKETGTVNFSSGKDSAQKKGSLRPNRSGSDNL